MAAGLFFSSGIDEGFEKDLEKMNRQYNKLVKNVQTKGAAMDSTFRQVGATIGAYFGAQQLVQFGKSIVQVRAEFQKFGIVLENTLGSAEEADQALEMVSDFAAETPFQLKELTGSFVKLVNQGFKPTKKELVALGDLASSQGKGFEQLTEAVIDAQVGEFERLKEFGIRAKKAGDQVTFSFKGVEQTVGFTSQSIQDYILSLGQLEGVAGANAKIAESLSGKISNLGDTWDKMLNSIGESNEGLINDILDGSKWVIENYETILKVVKTLVIAYGSYKAATIAVNQYQKIQRAILMSNVTAMRLQAQTGKQVAGANIFMAKTFKSLKAAIAANPIGLLVTGISLAIPLIQELTESTSAFVKLQNDVTDVAGTAQKAIVSQKNELEKLLSVAEDETKSLDERKQAIKKLREINPKYLGDLTLQKVKTGEARTAVDLYTKALLRNARVQAAKEKIIELEKERIDVLTQGNDIEIGFIDELVNGLKNVADVEGFLDAQRDTFQANQKKRADEIEKRIKKLAKIAAIGTEEGVEFISPTPDAPKGTKKKDEKSLNYYERLKKSLKEAEEALLDLSGTQEQVNVEAIVDQNKVIDNLKQQIKEQETLLGLDKEKAKEKKKEKEFEEGSIAYLEDKISKTQQLVKETSDPVMRASLQDEVVFYEEQLKLIKGVVEQRKEAVQLTFLELVNKRKQITEEMKGLNILSEAYQKLAKEREGIDKALGGILGYWTSATASALGQIANDISVLNEDAANLLSDLGKVIDDVSGIIAGVASGNYIQAFTSTIGVITTLVSKISDKESNIERLIKSQNKELKEQLDILEKVEGTRKIEAYTASFEKLNEQLAELRALRGKILDADEFDRRNWDDDLQRANAQYEELIGQLGTLKQEFQELITATTSTGIEQSILEGFKAGKSGIEDFGETFEEIMRASMLKLFSIRNLEGQFDVFFKQFAAAAESGLEIDAQELAALEKEFNNKIQIASDKFQTLDELLNSFLGTAESSDIETPNESITEVVNQAAAPGAIAQTITEETGSQLVGRLGAILLNSERLVLQGNDLVDYAVRNLVYMKQIKENTDYLPQIEENTRKTVEKLENF